MATKDIHSVENSLQQLRKACLARGVNGIKTFGRTFRIYDDDDNRSVSFNEFRKGLQNYGLQLNSGDMKNLFDYFDTDGSGSLNFDEFLLAVRPPMSDKRKKLIMKAFHKCDRTGDGTITIEDLKGIYSAKHHPKYISGEKTQAQVFREFLQSFEGQGDVPGDGRVTLTEFINYYSGVSASIDNDGYFDLMMTQAWKLNE